MIGDYYQMHVSMFLQQVLWRLSQSLESPLSLHLGSSGISCMPSFYYAPCDPCGTAMPGARFLASDPWLRKSVEEMLLGSSTCISGSCKNFIWEHCKNSWTSGLLNIWKPKKIIVHPGSWISIFFSGSDFGDWYSFFLGGQISGEKFHKTFANTFSVFTPFLLVDWLHLSKIFSFI